MRTFTKAAAVVLAAGLVAGSAVGQSVEPAKEQTAKEQPAQENAAKERPAKEKPAKEKLTKEKARNDIVLDLTLDDVDGEVVRIEKVEAEKARELGLMARNKALEARQRAMIETDRALAATMDKMKGSALLRYKSDKEKAAYLGVSTSAVTGALREQLKLQKGVGLVVEHVDPGSPAEKAGLKKYDIVQKLNDQLLINAHQLAVLVRTYKPGEEVELHVLREGKGQTVKIGLVEKEVPVLDDRSPYASIADFEFSPMLAQPAQPGFPAAPPAPVAVNARPGRAWALGGAQPRTMGRVKFNADQQVMNLSDGEHNLTLTNKDGQRMLRAEDKAGKVLYEGPIEDREKIPAEITGKLRQLELMEQQQGVPALKDIPKVGSLFKVSAASNRSLEFSDGDETISIKMRDMPQGRRLTMKVRDARGDELYHGPIQTAEEREMLPEEYKKKLEDPAVKKFLDEIEKGGAVDSATSVDVKPKPQRVK